MALMIAGLLNDVDIMSSLQRPRKITVIGSDGKHYSFLCKAKDDLRKDARLMEFNSIINKLLKKDSASRKRNLGILTYAVVPLDEECGLIEWVNGINGMRWILIAAYEARGIQQWNNEIKTLYDQLRLDPHKTGERFERTILPLFPAVFHDWFVEAFPEPSAWLRARTTYSTSTAVMAMVGFILGLGDRHGENILIDLSTGAVLHVDFNCLFGKVRVRYQGPC